jgi:hypothetical protein
MARVGLNGTTLGVVWCPPFRVDITDSVEPVDNRLEIEVVNFWPNRIIGDASLATDQRRTHTNVRQFRADTPLLSSGLLGPVRLMESPGTNVAMARVGSDE